MKVSLEVESFSFCLRGQTHASMIKFGMQSVWNGLQRTRHVGMQEMPTAMWKQKNVNDDLDG